MILHGIELPGKNWVVGVQWQAHKIDDNPKGFDNPYVIYLTYLIFDFYNKLPCGARARETICWERIHLSTYKKIYILEKIMVNNDLGNIEPIEIQKEMSSSYLDYAMR